MTLFKSQFTRIKDVSDRRRLPRLGKIRLGVKMVSQKSGKEYPKETDYFVCPAEVQKVFGEKPKEIEVMFPLNTIDEVFPQRYVWFGSSRGIKCVGDGEKAMRIEEPTGQRYEEMIERECPCELLDNGCSMKASLMFMVPKVSVGGIYQIDLGSYNSIVDVNSGLDYVQALIGRFAFVPLKLKREPRDTYGSGQKQVHHTLKVYLEGDLNFINSLRESTSRILAGAKYALPAPVMENPVFDEGSTIEVESEDISAQEENPPDMETEVVNTLKMLKSQNEVIQYIAKAKTMTNWTEDQLERLSREATKRLVDIKKASKNAPDAF